MSALATLQVRAGSELGLVYVLIGVAGTTQVLLSVLVVDEELALLAVAVGLVAGNGDQVEHVVGLVEDCVHFLQRAVGGFGVEEIDDREDEGVAGRAVRHLSG